MDTYVIGCDESGTGAWAGSFHIAAVAVDVLPFNRAVGRHLKDSKALSDDKRRQAVPLITKNAIAHSVIEVPVWEIDLGHKTAWRLAISKALREIKQALNISREDAHQHTLLIDGLDDYDLVSLLKTGGWRHPRFGEGLDERFPAVMAASILAKTARNDVMIGLSSEFPEYGWAQNKGYGVPRHREACWEFGVTKHHRRIKPLKKCKPYVPKEQWFEDDRVEE